MPRPERSVPAGDGSLSDLARHLRALRGVAGQPTYRELGRRAHFAASTLARAASGQQLPSLAVAIAYAAACGQDIERTRYLWERAAQFAAARKAAQSAAPRTNLPPALQGFTARGLETAALEDWLRDDPEPGSARIAAIVGPAGIGKTALAVRFAHQIRSLFPDGAFYADLRGFGPAGAPVDPGDQLGILLRLVEPGSDRPPPETEARVTLFRDALSGRRVLVVLDNAADTGQVLPLLPVGTGCAALVTSRSRLAELAIRFGARRIRLDPLPDADARQLLRQHIGSVRADAAPAAITQLARCCAGLPLALRLAAERASLHADQRLDAVADELAAERQRLDLLGAVADSHTAIRAVLSWSYRVLPDDAARLFQVIGLHDGPDIHVSAMAAAAGVPMARARRGIEVLTDAHLAEETGQDRYGCHDLLRIYAAELAQSCLSAEALRAAEIRLLSWYLHTMDAADRALAPGRRHLELGPPPGDVRPMTFADYDAALAWCDQEQASFSGAVRRAARIGEHVIGWQLAAALWSYFHLRKPWRDWAACGQAGLECAQRARDLPGQAQLCTSLAHVHGDLGQHDQSIDYLQQALAIARQVRDIRGVAASLSNLGEVEQMRGCFEAALAFHRQALEACASLDDPRTDALARHNAGVACLRLGRHAEAMDFLTTALAIRSQIGDRHGEACTRHSLGDALRHLALPGRARRHYQQALALRRQISDRHGQAVTLAGLADLADDETAHGKAELLRGEALRLLDDLHDPGAEALRAKLGRPDKHHS